MRSVQIEINFLNETYKTIKNIEETALQKTKKGILKPTVLAAEDQVVLC